MTPAPHSRVHAQDAAERERTEAYWRSQIAREVYLKAEEISRIKVGGIRMGEATAQVIRAVGDTIGRMPQRPRVWPQDNATDVTVAGDVLTEEPGSDVLRVTDADGYVWRRVALGWRYGTHYTYSWTRLAQQYGPIRSAS